MNLTAEQIGEYLEHQGATDDEIDIFLQHFGVRGMRWGVRRTTDPTGRTQVKRSTGSKATIVVGALGAGHIAGKIVSKYAGKNIRKPGVYFAAAVGTTAATVAGARAARSLVDRRGNVSKADLQRLQGKHINEPGLTGKETAYVGYSIAGAALAAAMLGRVYKGQVK